MYNSHIADDYGDLRFSLISWKHYNLIKKKAMEQEFSMSGLLLSLSIAFFIVIIAAFVLSGLNTMLHSDGIIFSQINDNSLHFETFINLEAKVFWEERGILQFRA